MYIYRVIMSRSNIILNTNCGIYRMISPTHKVYIGKSKNLKRRESSYKLIKFVKSQRKLYNSLMKYGFDAHNFEVVEFLNTDASEEELIELETLILNQYKNADFEVLNLREPGPKGKMSKESIERIKESLKGNNYALGSKEQQSGKIIDL